MSPEDAARRPNPFVGPSPLQPGQPLYGRDLELFDLRNLLIAERIVVLYSPSGAGKTSLIRAGLLETLEEAEFHVLPVISLSQPPAANGASGGNRYLESTIRSLDEDLPDAEQVRLAELEHLPLRDYLEQRPRAPDAPATDLLIFDQFEQIVTLDPADRDAKTEFFMQVGEVLRHGDRWALFSLREDHLAGLDPFRRWIPRQLDTAFRLEFLSPQAARETIRRTAQQGGVDFTEDAADRLVTDLGRVRVQQPDGSVSEEMGQEVEPVQLQVVCHRLWNHLPAEEDRIGLDLVERYGKVDEALGEFYAESVSQVAETTGIPERDIRVWFDEHLITKRGIRGQVLQEPGQSAGLEDEAIGALIDMHVVRAESRRGAVWFELAHDRLIEPIQASNDAWYQVNLNAFQQQARLWQSQGRVSGYLLADEALVQAEQWATQHPDELTPVEREYLATCQEHRRAQDAERRLRDLAAAQQLAQEAQARQRAEERARLEAEQRVAEQAVAERRLRRLLFVAVGLGAMAGILAIAALFLFGQANKQREVAETLELESSSRLLGEKALDETKPRLSLLLGVEALNLANTFEARRALLRGLSGAPVSTVWLKESPIGDLAFSPDGAHLFVGDQSGSVASWLGTEAESWQRPSLELESRARGSVRTVAYSPDGDTFAVGGDGGLEIRDSANRDDPKQVTPDDVQGVAFSPDGARVVYGQANGSVTSVDLGDELTPAVSKTLLPPQGVGRGIDGNTVAVSSEGWIAAGLQDGSIFFWGPAGEHREITLSVSPGSLTALSFDREGTRLAAGDNRGGVWWWEIDGPAPENRYEQSKFAITSVAFSPDGATMAASDQSGLIGFWSMEDENRIDLLPTGSGAVSSIAFHPDGDFLAAGNYDGSISLWSLHGPPLAVAPPVNIGLAEVSAVAFTPDAAMFAAAGDAGTVRLCERPEGQLTCTTVRESGAPVQSLAISVGGDQLALGDESETIAILSVDGSGRVVSLEMDSGDYVCGLTFAADDQFVAAAVGSRARVGGCDRTRPGAIVVWNLATGERERTSRTRAVTAIASDAEGRRLASADTQVTVWEIEDGGLSPFIPTLGVLGADDLAFSSDGAMLAAASTRFPAGAGQVYVWEMAPASEISAEDRGTEALAIDFSRDGQELASGHVDGLVALWDVARRERVGSLGSLHAEVRGVAWTDARTVLVVGAEGSLVEFHTSPELDPQRWQDRACRVAGKDFTAGEARRILHDESERACT